MADSVLDQTLLKQLLKQMRSEPRGSDHQLWGCSGSAVLVWTHLISSCPRWQVLLVPTCRLAWKKNINSGKKLFIWTKLKTIPMFRLKFSRGTGTFWIAPGGKNEALLWPTAPDFQEKFIAGVRGWGSPDSNGCLEGTLANVLVLFSVNHGFLPLSRAICCECSWQKQQRDLVTHCLCSFPFLLLVYCFCLLGTSFGFEVYQEKCNVSSICPFQQLHYMLFCLACGWKNKLEFFQG